MTRDFVLRMQEVTGKEQPARQCIVFVKKETLSFILKQTRHLLNMNMIDGRGTQKLSPVHQMPFLVHQCKFL